MFKNSNNGDYFSPLTWLIIIFSLIDIVFFRFITNLVKVEYLSIIITIFITDLIIFYLRNYTNKQQHFQKENNISLEKIFSLEQPFAINKTRISKENIISKEKVTNEYWFDFFLINSIISIFNIVTIFLSYRNLWFFEFNTPFVITSVIISIVFMFFAIFVKKQFTIEQFNKINSNDEIACTYYFFKDMVVLQDDETKDIKIIPCFDIRKELTTKNISYNIFYENYRRTYFIIDTNGFVDTNKKSISSNYKNDIIVKFFKNSSKVEKL